MPLLGGSFLKAGNEISVFQNENLIKITGVIKDSKGEPLIGVNIGVKGSSEELFLIWMVDLLWMFYLILYWWYLYRI